ncbi:probable apyrase 7 [Zingiber officinale]|nr:probable apyrase 7 [Zingiber officinale]XP_042468774.1 probable apyrase 7 [Zingiber officinale]
MRLSLSLQDLKSFSKLNSDEHEDDRSYGRSKPFHALQNEVIPSSLVKEKSLPLTQPKPKKWARATLGITMLLLLLSLIFVCSKFVHSYLSQEASRYYVVLDCGSTGTRAYVYKWLIDQKGDKNFPIALKSLPEDPERNPRMQSGRAYQRMETEPGFDKLVHNESGIRAALHPLLQWAEKQIPKHAHRGTSVFLLATAGVRGLPGSDSDWLLNKAWDVLKNSSFLCRRDWIKIISGMEEAYYGWIALNYHMGLLGSLPVGKTYGSLDLGGSSLQVTFETETLTHHDTSISLRIASTSHYLNAYSLSGFGLNEAFDKSVAHLFRKVVGTSDGFNNEKFQLRHPCLNSGYKEEYTCSRCTPNLAATPGFGGRTGTVVELLGTPQWEECNALAKLAVNLSAWTHLSSTVDCELKPCALSDDLPHPHGKFYAMSGFFVVFRFFGLSSEASLEDVLKKGQEFCVKPWEAAMNSVAPQPYIEQYCFRAPYVISLLRDGLHINDSQVVIGSGSITWTLAVALLEAGQTFSNLSEVHGYKIVPTDMHPAFLVAMLLFLVLFLCYALYCIRKMIPKLFRRSYLPLHRHNSVPSSVLSLPFQRWSPINSVEGKIKAPLSPTIDASEQHPFSMGHVLGSSNTQEPSVNQLASAHSYSSGSLGQLLFINGAGSSWTPHGSQRKLSSRRSQSREDLSSSVAEVHTVKV